MAPKLGGTAPGSGETQFGSGGTKSWSGETVFALSGVFRGLERGNLDLEKVLLGTMRWLSGTMDCGRGATTKFCKLAGFVRFWA